MTVSQERRALLAQRAQVQGVREIRSRSFAGCELRDVPNGTGGSACLFTGYASVFNTPYTVSDSLGEYTERVRTGAFDKTLAGGADTVFLLNHEGMSLARSKSGTLRLSADSTGLFTEARLDPANYQVVALRSAIERGDIDEMSFAFRTLRQAWNKDYDDRQLLELSLHQGDVSAVNYGANGATAGTVAMRKRQRAMVAASGICTCCAMCTQADCDGTCCDACEMGADNADVAGASTDSPNALLSLGAMADYVVRCTISRLQGQSMPSMPLRRPQSGYDDNDLEVHLRILRLKAGPPPMPPSRPLTSEERWQRTLSQSRYQAERLDRRIAELKGKR